jgi:hypothetical protein
MSSLRLRAAVRADWSRLTAGLRYVETINRSLPRNPPLPLPDVWGSLAFDAETRRHMTMGADPWVEERGQVVFGVFGRSGHGDVPALTAAEAIVAASEGWASPAGDAWFVSVGAPRQVEMEAEGEWFMLSVTAIYILQERIQLPPP